MSIQEQLQIVEGHIEEACKKSGRKREEVTLIAVSKTKPVSMLLTAMEMGVRVFGENKVQELKSKVMFINSAAEESYASLTVTSEDVTRRDVLFANSYAAGDGNQKTAETEKSAHHPLLTPDDINWHLIGTLQTNKVKYLPPLGLSMIHSVDNLKLAEEIEARYQAYEEMMTESGLLMSAGNKVEKDAETDGRLSVKNGLQLPVKGTGIDVLIEVNMAHEESKMGLAPSDVQTLITQMAPFEHIRVRGLMTIAPETGDPESNRGYFAGLRELMADINRAQILEAPMTELSMGMTGDYQIAIEEGATFVRVGTGIFGERNYTKA